MLKRGILILILLVLSSLSVFSQDESVYPCCCSNWEKCFIGSSEDISAGECIEVCRNLVYYDSYGAATPYSGFPNS